MYSWNCRRHHETHHRISIDSFFPLVSDVAQPFPAIRLLFGIRHSCLVHTDDFCPFAPLEFYLIAKLWTTERN